MDLSTSSTATTTALALWAQPLPGLTALPAVPGEWCSWMEPTRAGLEREVWGCLRLIADQPRQMLGVELRARDLDTAIYVVDARTEDGDFVVGTLALCGGVAGGRWTSADPALPMFPLSRLREVRVSTADGKVLVVARVQTRDRREHEAAH